MQRYLVSGCIAAAATLGTAQAATFGDLFAFGDSLADCCFLGPFTQGDTQTWVDLLPDRIGASYEATPERNLAVGGAQSGPTNAIPATDAAFGVLTGFTTQVARFLASPLAATVGGDDIAAIWVGTNDIWAAPFSGGPSPLGEINTAFAAPPTPEALAAYVRANIADGIAALRGLGLGSVAILTPYDLADAELVVTPGTRPLVTDYSLAVRDALEGLYTPGIDTYVLDMVDLLRGVQDDADALGFDFLTGAESCDAGAVAALGAGATCADLPEAEQDRYVFADFIHLTNATNEIIADELARVIDTGGTVPAPAPVPLPASIALLGGAVMGLGAIGRRVAKARNVP
jgi:phospholipase/lecithinase/hemolysin